MAHEILDNAFIEATHNGRFAAWHGIGERKDAEFLTLSDLLSDGINFRTEFKTLSIPSGTELDFARCIVRQDTGEPLSVVGSRYEITQHVDFFTDVDKALNGAKFETAGVLRGGREVFALVQSGQFAIAGRDLVENYVYFRTSYDGTSPTKAKAVNTRVVCMNTTRIALAEEGTSFDYSFRHTKNSDTRIKEVLSAVSRTNQAGEEFVKRANLLASRPFSRTDVQTVIATALESAYGKIEDATTQRTADSKAESYREGADYMANALALPENKDLGKWALYNAVSQWTDHNLSYSLRESSRRNPAEKRFESVMDGRADKVKQTVFSLIYLTTDGKEIEVPITADTDYNSPNGRDILDQILTESGN